MSNTDIERGTIIFVASLQSEFQISMFKALQSFGWIVETFDWQKYIQKNIWEKIQAEYLFGPVMKQINEALVDKCKTYKPDVVFIYKGIYVWPETISKIKHCTRLVISYNPDNPFGNFNYEYAKKYRIKGNILLSKLITFKKSIFFRRLWGNFIKTIPVYDINFVPRISQISEYKRIGARYVHLLRWYYDPELHRHVELTEDDIVKFGSDVLLIGRYEPDNRRECIGALLDAGVHMRLFGTGWDHYLSRKLKNTFGKSIRPVYGEDYTKALCSSKIVLNFQAKLNKDTSTIRCFEVPACGALLLSERTNELMELFEEDKEAVYFSDSSELVEKVKDLLNNPEKRNAIAKAGHRRCVSDGHDVYSRMRECNDIVCAKLKTLPLSTSS